ncbi:MAG: hypothetical protein HC915_20175 [Anaerolineae bacterium]|nr:hypothetical protein [Anaerolineae bacterium]
MRIYRTLDEFSVAGHIAQLRSSESGALAVLALAREGERLNISVSIGALELALRLRYDEMVRQLELLTPQPGFVTTRHIGSGQAYMEVGMTQEQGLILRPTLASDATGHLTANLVTTRAVFEALQTWLSNT